MVAIGPVLEDAVIQAIFAQCLTTPSALNVLHPITCILKPLASNTKLPLPDKTFTVDHSGAQGCLTLFTGLGGDPETSADRFFFGSSCPPMGTVTGLPPNTATDAEMHWGSRSFVRGNRQKPSSCTMQEERALQGL